MMLVLLMRHMLEMLGSFIGSRDTDQEALYPTIYSLRGELHIESQPNRFIDCFFLVVYNKNLGKSRYA
jgi:hypothetical protein